MSFKLNFYIFFNPKMLPGIPYLTYLAGVSAMKKAL
jgi:hypothetical protein